MSVELSGEDSHIQSIYTKRVLCQFSFLRWGSYLYYNAEIVNNGDKIKLRDALGNFIKSPAVQVPCNYLGIDTDKFIFSCSGIWKDTEASMAANANQWVLEHLESACGQP